MNSRLNNISTDHHAIKLSIFRKEHDRPPDRLGLSPTGIQQSLGVVADYAVASGVVDGIGVHVHVDHGVCVAHLTENRALLFINSIFCMVIGKGNCNFFCLMYIYIYK